MKVVGMIPVRLESSRLPGKALIDICGYPMIIHVLKRTLMAKSLDEVFVVTDNEKIKSVVESYGGSVLMTGTHHQTGSDRLAEAADSIEADYIVNIQGDEALVNPEHIDLVTEAVINSEDCPIGFLVTPFKKYNSPGDIKAVLNENNEVMYISRSDIPSNARTESPDMLKVYHIVPFRKDFLLQYSKWSKTKLELIEFNEYLRILEKGYKIKAVHVDSAAISVDTYSDLEFVREKMKTDSYFKMYF